MSDVVRVRKEVVTLAGWPTDVVRVDQCRGTMMYPSSSTVPLAHTVLVFVPGNPGCIGWYTDTLVHLVERLGPGFAARGVSYAGHSANEELTQVESQWSVRDVSIPWTIDGQIQHKCAFMDNILSEYYRPKSKHAKSTVGVAHNTMSSRLPPRFVFLSHSIGSHMVQRLLILRPDILSCTIGTAHLMPFIRMDAGSDQAKLDWAGAHPSTLIRVAKCGMQCLRWLPFSIANHMAKGIMDDEKKRVLAIRLLRQPTFARHFFELGTEEIRDVPETVDVSALSLISRQCPIAMLYAGKDHWAPSFQMKELQDLQVRRVIPSNISFTYMEELRHDYVSYSEMVPTVVDWCYGSIRKMTSLHGNTNSDILRSKL